MPKLKSDLYAVPDGEIYPVMVPAGADCPENMLTIAQTLGVLGDDTASAPAIAKPARKG